MPGTIGSATYEQLDGDLNAALAWVSSHGIEVHPTRLGHYRRAFDDLLEIYRTRDEGAARSKFKNLVTVLFEIHEIILIHDGLKNEIDNEYLRPKLREMVKGPVSYVDENSSASNYARNIAFELTLAARLRSAGLSLDHTLNVDTACRCANRTLLFECKRPRSEQKLEANVRDASRQLKERYKNPKRTRYRGVVAVDMSLIANPGFKFLDVASSGELGARLDAAIEGAIDQYVPAWRKAKHPQTIAIMLRLAILAINRERESEITYCQQYGLTPLHDAGPDYMTAESLGEALSASLSNNALQATQ